MLGVRARITENMKNSHTHPSPDPIVPPLQLTLTTPCALPRSSLHSASSSPPILAYPLFAMYPTASTKSEKYILVSRSSRTK